MVSNRIAWTVKCYHDAAWSNCWRTCSNLATGASTELGDAFLNDRHPDQKMDFENAVYYRCRRASNLSVRFASGSA